MTSVCHRVVFRVFIYHLVIVYQLIVLSGMLNSTHALIHLSPVSTTRVEGPSTRVHFLTPVNSGVKIFTRVHGPSTRPMETGLYRSSSSLVGFLCQFMNHMLALSIVVGQLQRTNKTLCLICI